MGIVGGKKIVKYSLIQRPQTDVSSAESGLKMCIVWLIGVLSICELLTSI